MLVIIICLLSDLLLVFPLLCAILRGAESCKLHHLGFPTNWFSVSFSKKESDKDEKVGRGKMLDISAHLFQLQAASSRAPVSPPLFWLSLHRLGSRALVTCVLLHPSSPTGGRSSWWGISASQLAISALLVPLQLAPDIKKFPLSWWLRW